MSEEREREYDKELVSRLKQWRQGEKAPPIKVDARLHDLCNLKCVYCSKKAETRTKIRERLSTQKWVDIVGEAAQAGVRHWNFEGVCEPVFFPHQTMRVMNKVKDVGLYGHITTNGTLWKEEQLRDLINIGWDEMSFSLDALSQSHDQLTGVDGSWKMTVEGIEDLNRLKRELGSNKPLLNINTVLTDKNYQELPQIVDFCCDKDVHFLFVDPVFPATDQAEDISLKTNEKLQKIIDESRKKAKKNGLRCNFTGDHSNLELEMIDKIGNMGDIVKEEALRYQNIGDFMSVRCYKPWFNLRINHRGEVGYCSGPDTALFADIKNKSIEEIWYGPQFEKIRDRLLRKEAGYCDNCPASFMTMRRSRRDLLAKSLNS